MSNLLPEKSFVVVADGAGARFFRLHGHDKKAALVSEGVYHPTHVSDGEGPSGKSPPERSGREASEAVFAKQLAQELYRRAHNGEFTALILIADPQTLGQIRPVLHKEVQSRIVRDIAKSLTKASQDDILKAIEA
jgi:protein required for attachment to host cells